MIISKFQRNRENVIFRQNSHKREPTSPNPWRRKDRNNLKDESINLPIQKFQSAQMQSAERYSSIFL